MWVSPDMTDSPDHSGANRTEKMKIEALILRLEEAHCQDIQAVRTDVQLLSDRVKSGEASLSVLELLVAALEHSQDSHIDTAMALQLHLEHLEDRSRRNNLWQRAQKNWQTQLLIFSTRYWTPDRHPWS